MQQSAKATIISERHQVEVRPRGELTWHPHFREVTLEGEAKALMAAAIIRDSYGQGRLEFRIVKITRTLLEG